MKKKTEKNFYNNYDYIYQQLRKLLIVLFISRSNFFQSVLIFAVVLTFERFFIL